MRAFASLSVLLLGAACASVAPSAAARLAALDPLRVDPGQIEVVLRLPPGLSFAPGTAVLEVAATRGRDRVAEKYRLEMLTAADAGPPGGPVILTLALMEPEAARMRALQRQVADWRGTGGSGTLGVGIEGCAIGDGPAPGARGSVLLRTEAGGPLQPLVNDKRLVDILGADVMAAIKPCAAPA